MRWLPAVAGTGAIVVMLLDAGTPALDILRYAVYLAWGLVLPGTLVYRSLRRTPHTLIEDLTLGTTLGLVLEIGAWAAFSVVHAERLLLLWPLFVVVPFVAIRPLRRHWRPIGYQPTPNGWSWAVSAMVVFLVGYVYVTYLRQTEPIPTGGDGAWYHIDLLYLLSVTAEAKHHFPLMNPHVAGEPLHYHWFSYAHMAIASLISGVDTPMVFFRLASPVFCALAVLTLAVAGWRVSGKPWVGALAAMLAFTVGELSPVDMFMSWGPFGSVVAYMVWSSHSMAYSWAVTFALLAVVVDLLRRGGGPAPMGRGAWVLLALWLVGAGGSKSTVIPVLLGGLGIAGLAHLVTRRRIEWRVVGVGAAVAGGAFFATAVIYRFESHGLQLWPAADFSPFVASTHARSALRTVGVYGLVSVGYLLFMYARLAGVFLLPRRAWGTVEWFLLGSLLAGATATLAFIHPGNSQNFFVRTAFGFGAILSAMGFAALVERYQVPARTLVALFAGIIAGMFALMLALRYAGLAVPSSGWRGMLPTTNLALAVAVIGAAVWLVGRRRRRGVAVVAIVAAVLLAGTPSLVFDGWDNTRKPARWYHSYVTDDEAAAARWLRAHTSPDEVIATNQHCLREKRSAAGCPSLSYWLSAYSERRQLLGSWLYTSRETEEMMARGTTIVPFSDPQLQADNDIVFTAPTAERVGLLRDRYGVHWLVVDRDQGRESAALRTLANLPYSAGTVAIYQIR